MAMGVYSALSVWFPGLRGRWKGARIPAGPMVAMGFGLMFVSGGVLLAGNSTFPAEVRHALLVVALAGFGGAAIGWVVER